MAIQRAKAKFTIADIEKVGRGTEINFASQREEKEFLDDWRFALYCEQKYSDSY